MQNYTCRTVVTTVSHMLLTSWRASSLRCTKAMLPRIITRGLLAVCPDTASPLQLGMGMLQWLIERHSAQYL